MAGRKPISGENVGDLERSAFRIDDATTPKTVSKAVCDETTHDKLDDLIAASGGGRLSYQITYNTTTDVIQYFSGGLGGTLEATLTITYENARKKRILSGEWT